MHPAYVVNASRTGESLAITRRRNNEERLHRYEDIRRDNAAVAQRAYWERNSAKAIDRNNIAKLARNIEETEAQALDARRRKLAEKLAAEEEQYKVEIIAMQETSDQKAQRMVAHARELKRQREARRIKFAQEMYNKQWVLACDDLRHIGSERFGAYCREQIADQRAEKINKKFAEQREEDMWARSWEQQRLKKVEEEEEMKRRRQRFNHETKMALFDQMETTRQLKLKDAYEQELEQQKFREQMEADAAFAKKCQEEAAQMRKAKMDEILAFNAATQAAKREVEMKQKEQEMRDLQDKIQMLKADLDEEARQKRQARTDMMNYMDYRQQLREAQRREELEMERLCQIELDKENAKRDATYAKEQAAREQLHADVMRGRGQQLLALQQKYRNLEIELEVERDAVQREARLAIEEERAAEEAMRAKGLRHQQDILRQMHEARERKRLEEALVIEDRETAIENERAYRAFVERERAIAEQQGAEFKPEMFARK